MSSYSTGGRGPNVSQYLANLNAIPSAQDPAAPPDNYLEDDLALFTNVEFLENFDLGETPDIVGVNFNQAEPREDGSLDSKDAGNDGKEMNYNDGYGFNDMTFPPQIQTSLPQPADFSSVQYTSPTSYTSPSSATAPKAGDKRPHSSQQDLEVVSRAAAEEDKRRRNTAASARFRVKKKQREQALEKTAKEMGEKVDQLEGRVAELERENKWLRGLVVEKSSVEAGASPTEVLKKLDQKPSDERNTSGAKKGVGTVKEEEKAGKA